MADLFTHPVAQIVSRLLIGLGVAVTRTSSLPSWSISVNSEEDAPDDVITVYDTGARSWGRSQTTGDQLSHPAVQIRVRGRDQKTAYDRAKLIATKLDRNVNHVSVTVGSSTYCVQSISRVPGILFFGKESETSQRRIFLINAYATIRQTA